MFEQIIKKIEQFNNIVIARHIGVDPDALCSQLALRDSIKLTYPDKNVIAIGTSSSRFACIGKLDSYEKKDDSLLIVLDTPDKKRIDMANPCNFTDCIKIDHHPFIEEFASLELIDEEKTSTCEIIMTIIDQTNLQCNREIIELLYMGLVSDSERFLFSNTKYKTFELISKYLKKYPIDITKAYEKLYFRPLSEVRLEGYISYNMEVTKNNLAYIIIDDETLRKLNVDSAAPANMINHYNYINEVLTWVTITEDIRNQRYRISIRSRGPEINKVAEKYQGGGHKYASGIKVKTIEEAKAVIKDLDKELEKYNQERVEKHDN